MATEQQFVFPEGVGSVSMLAKASSKERVDLPDGVRFLSARVSQNDVSLAPYSRIGEAWTLSDDVVIGIVHRCQQEGAFATVFYDGRVSDEFEFVDAMKDASNVPVFAYLGTEPIGFAWLNGVCGHYAFGHFCFLKASSGRAVDAGKMIVDYWMSFIDGDEPLLDVIVGTVPASNVRALDYVKKLGFSAVGSIPGMLRVKGQKEAAVILYRERNH